MVRWISKSWYERRRFQPNSLKLFTLFFDLNPKGAKSQISRHRRRRWRRTNHSQFHGKPLMGSGILPKNTKNDEVVVLSCFSYTIDEHYCVFFSTSSVKTVGLPCCSFEINANLCTVVRFQWKSMKNVALSLFSLHKRWNSLYSRVFCIKNRWKPLYYQAFS